MARRIVSLMAKVEKLLARPLPPDDLASVEGATAPDRFVPAPELTQWIRDAYLDAEGPLFTEEHGHLTTASIGCLWTNAENTRHMRRIVGQAEIPAWSNMRSGKWQKARASQQLMEWFGAIPDFLLTFDALYAEQIDDPSFSALVDHELFHCAQEEDEFGQPKFRKSDGKPVWRIRGHDLEEFVGVVRRFGVEAAGQAATDFVIAAAKRPEIARGKLAQACGTCLKVAA